MAALLFVYGTLCADCGGELGRAQRARLAAESLVLGEARTSGQLIDLGDYPGLVEGPGEIHGVLLELSNPARTLSWLDDYEGATGAADREYDRVARPVVHALGGERLAWVYRLRAPVAGAKVLTGGRWRGRAGGAGEGTSEVIS